MTICTVMLPGGVVGATIVAEPTDPVPEGAVALVVVPQPPPAAVIPAARGRHPAPVVSPALGNEGGKFLHKVVI
jgi:hypothetical protein